MKYNFVLFLGILIILLGFSCRFVELKDMKSALDMGRIAFHYREKS